jgi:hypothetical protein
MPPTWLALPGSDPGQAEDSLPASQPAGRQGEMIRVFSLRPE